MEVTALVRRAVFTDIPYGYEICLRTGNAGADAAPLFYDPFALGHYYFAPYICFEKGVNFMLDFNFSPSGYIVATPDTGAFNLWMESQWLAALRQRYPLKHCLNDIRSSLEEQTFKKIHEPLNPVSAEKTPWIATHPAHLHINILKHAQGHGLGRLMMDTLCKMLTEQGVLGVHLGVDIKNTEAIAFYTKMGFTCLHEGGGLVMGKLLAA